ncbi:MAG: insulinase family protein, partial [Oscillibacter sp.]|nr:insulinase family protein [Oscillibacter sp.]
LSAQFITPIREDTAGANALLCAVLRRGTVTYPDMGALRARMDELYDASIEYTVRKMGESQCVGFVAGMIDDRFAPEGEKLLEPTATLLGELICDPVTYHGRFRPEYFESEKTNLLEGIRSVLNDKRAYADHRLLRAMCAREPYAVPCMGEEKAVEKLQLARVYAQYKKLVSTAPLEIFYSGGAPLPRVEQALREAFATLPRQEIAPVGATVPHARRREVLYREERLDVTQGKLGMGFACESDDDAALLMGNTIFGGSSNSRLFLNVREKLSLCYYASSVFHRKKKIITVSSGIEFANYEKALNEILAQLAAVQRGEFEEWELEGARSVMLNSYASMADSQGRLENYCLGQVATGADETPEDLARAAREMTAERVCRAMQSVRLDTVYFLRGEEETK